MQDSLENQTRKAKSKNIFKVKDKTSKENWTKGIIFKNKRQEKSSKENWTNGIIKLKGSEWEFHTTASTFQECSEV